MWAAHREGPEDRLAALGPVVNVVALWNSSYLSAIVDHLCAQGIPIEGEDVARPSLILSEKGIRRGGLSGAAAARPPRRPSRIPVAAGRYPRRP
ncbi:Tn3 family transposase [Rhizohabitans arisaemae]|uniref:Tn3 family transposase n=1 Tax=Rhizohabitans arisaemae TaxID=2720610 RepID=UPI003D161ACC